MLPTDLKIFLDLDGVVADWFGHAANYFGINLKTPAIQNLVRDKERAIEHIIDSSYMWKGIDAAGPQWWQDIPLFPWARFLYDECCKLGNVCFLTMPGINPASVHGKVNWIRNHFNTENFLIGKHKEFCAGPRSILIDDYWPNVDAFNQAGGVGFEFPNAWKCYFDHEDHYKSELPVIQRQYACEEIQLNIYNILKTISEMREGGNVSHDDE